MSVVENVEKKEMRERDGTDDDDEEWDGRWERSVGGGVGQKALYIILGNIIYLFEYPFIYICARFHAQPHGHTLCRLRHKHALPHTAPPQSSHL